MNNEKMGQFICELRKSNQMTQKDLASKLNITDKAVSKWERGLSCPDISLLCPIADILGVTTGELLNGEKSNAASKDIDESIAIVLQYADKSVNTKANSLKNLCAITFSLLLLVGVIICTICDLAISGTFTWSLYPISSIVFTWLVCFPAIKFGVKGILGSMIALSVLIIPFLYVLNHLIKINDLFFPIGVRMASIAIVFMWIIFAICKILRSRLLLATALSLLMQIPLTILVNLNLSKFIVNPIVDVWDILTFSISALIALFLFTLDYTTRKNNLK